MAQKAKKHTPPQKKKSALKPVKSVKSIPKKSPAKQAKLTKPTPRVQAAKPTKPIKSAKPAARVKPSTSAKSPKRVKPVAQVKKPVTAKSAINPKTVKPTKSTKQHSAPVPKKTSEKKPLALKSTPKTVVKSTKPAPVAKPAPKSVPAAKPAAKSAPPPKKLTPPPIVQKSVKPVVKSVDAKVSAPAKVASSKSQARDDLRSRILQKKGPVRPIAFSLDEIREIAKTTNKQEEELKAATTKVATKTTRILAADILVKPAQPNHIKAASLADILGFNPKKQQVPVDETDSIPEKFRRYYKLLIELRNHLTGQIDTHSEETLKRSSKDDSGDLSSYGQHMADAGTDTFDRDFALSLVSSEQEALSEVESAIKRIKDGSYGICENTQKPIAKERLVAVPFTRYSAEAQKDIEKNRMRHRTQAGLFGEMGEEGATLSPGSGGDGDDE